MKSFLLSALRCFGPAVLLLSAAHPGQAQVYSTQLISATGTVVGQGMAFTNAAAGRFTNDNSTVTYTGPASGTLVNDGRYVALNGGTDVFAGPGGNAGAQELGGSVAPRFYNLNLSNGAANFTSTNTAGLRVAGVLTFGNAYTITPRTQATNAAGAVHFLPGSSHTGITSGDDSRFVDGYVLKIGTGEFAFPVGQAGDQRPVQLTSSGLPAAADSLAVAWFSGSADTTPDPSDAGATHALTSVGAGASQVSANGFWDWVRPTTSGNVPVSVSIPAQSASFAAPADLRLVGWNGSQWVALGTSGTSSLAEGQLLSGTVPPGITALAVGKTSSPLPVTLLTFTGTLRGDDAQLAWRTATEHNSAYFEVQQSSDGSTWQPLGKVAAAGTSTTPRDYTFPDARISRYGVPVVYYRLRQVDQDGTEAYSPIVALRPTPATAFTLDLWPNPATVSTNAQLRIASPDPAAVTVTVLDATGRLVYEHTTAPGAELLLPSATWASGSYVVRAQQGTRTATRLLVRE
ncbi:MAG: T9SS type A sorting domain-containing protein [Janthinobacterium lividum]